MVGKPSRFGALRTALLALMALLLVPLSASAEGASVTVATSAPPHTADVPPVLATEWINKEWGVSIAPPAWWRQSPAESLNRGTEPADPVFELARFQLRLVDPSLYVQPVAPTSG